MLPVSPPRFQRRAAKGSALIIVLFFIVLMTIVTVAFLSRSLTAVKVASGSSGETKSKLLASSASDIIIGDFKQEIIAGSANFTGTTTPNSGTVNYPIYTPTTNATMIPFMNGVPMAGTPLTNAIPNLICRSVSPANTGGSAPYVAYPTYYTSTLIPPVRAANDASASTSNYANSVVNSATPSINGRYVSAKQWNSHYLIPRDPSIDSPGSTTADSTPVPAFVPPDWVIVTRGGVSSVSTSTPGMSTGGLNDPTPTNLNYAVGRYAYAVYNEGGLLDMNAAGFPGTDAASSSTGLTAAQIGKKGSLALADLTQLTAGTVPLTQAQVNNIVGWRNYSSAQPPGPGGAFPNFTFTGTSSSSWLTNFVLNNTNGFMQVVGSSTPPTDQAFLSRAQLISVIQSLGISPDFLQYMGTFSRALEQPSYVPNSNLPKIVGSALPPGPTAPNAAFPGYQGNNTYWGGESAINGRGANGFLGARVKTTFTRLDGTTAVVGEPLAKRKFALSRMALVTTGYSTYYATAASAASHADPVYQRFGLYRASATSPWIYDHGIAAGGATSSASVPAIIGTLTQVSNLSGGAGTVNAPREPDCAELLKAAINVGSVGKAGPSGTGGNDQYRMDVSGDMQILQIMADLIDQQKTDNFPTWIQYTQTTIDYTGATNLVIRNIFGDQDLPYFYRWNYYGVMTQAPSPLLAVTDTVSDAAGSALNHTKLLGGQTLVPGSCSYFIVPQVWNPHDANTPPASGGGPTQFRIVVSSYTGSSTAAPWKLNAVPGKAGGSSTSPVQFDGSPNPVGGDILPDVPASLLPAPIALTPPANTGAPVAGTSYLNFTDLSSGQLFREPTILWRNIPGLLALSGTSRTEDSSLTGKTYFGILVSDDPVSWTWTDSDSKTYISQTSSLQANAYMTGGAGNLGSDMEYQVQYLQTATNTWITYQDTIVEYTLTDYPGYALWVNKADLTNNEWENPLAQPNYNIVNSAGSPFARQQSGLFDPRSNRFSAVIGGTYSSDDQILNGNPTLDATTLVANGNPTPAQNVAVAATNFVLMKTNRPATSRGQVWEYTTPCRGYDNTMGWFSSATTCVGGGGNTFNSAVDANCFDGLLSQNNFLVQVLSGNNSSPSRTAQSYYYADPDGVARRAMGGYVPASGAPTGLDVNITSSIGLPTVTAGASFANGVETPSSQSQSRPILLHRPFRNVGEMSYAFRGSPWKNIDFFTPESGDSALLDVFCINEPPPTAMVAGKVDLNTRQAPVLKAILSSAYRDEFFNLATPPSGTLPALSTTEAGNIANTLVGITTSHNLWEGPLTSIADLVGHYVFPDPGTLSATDVYQFPNPSNNTEYTFSGLTAALSASSGIWDSSNQISSQNIQRFREASIRPLSDCGQTRVWNLLIDVVAQTGHYPKTATGLDQFYVEGQTRLWVHVAIDRLTGQVIDKQIEAYNP